MNILQSNPLTGIYNMTVLDSQQTIPSDSVELSVLVTLPYEDMPQTSSPETYDGFQYSPVSNPNNTSETSTTFTNNEHSHSTEGTPVSSSSNLNNIKQFSLVYSSNISDLPLSSIDMMNFNITEPDTSSRTSSSSESNGKIHASETGRTVSHMVLSGSYEQTTVPSASDSLTDIGVQNSTSQTDYVQNTPNPTTEGAIGLQNMPTTQTIQLTPVSQVDSYRSPHTSQIAETTSDSSNTNASSFPVGAIMADSQSQNDTHHTQSEGRQHSATSSVHFFQQLNASDSESNIETDNFKTSNGNQQSGRVFSPLPASSIPNKNLKPLSGEEMQIISLPTYHPNDVIHISSSELYPSDGIHNTSHEEKHPCARTCKEGSPSMVCRYRFELEWYYTMSKACYNCPLNLVDCNRKDCVVADGIRRPIVVVNRQMPGPSIEVSEISSLN